jgi:hypothetical protein
LISNTSINGIILEYGRREPIEYVRVTLQNDLQGELETYSDKNGEFSFKNLESGKYTITIDDINDFNGKRINIILSKDKKLEKEIFLKKTDNPTYVIDVNKKKKNKDINKKTIDKDEIEKIAGINGNFIEVIKKLPGVARNSSVNSDGIIIRGTGSLNSRIFIDGHYIPILYHFGGITPIFNSELIDSLDFFAGNYPVEFGKAIGGIVNVNIRDANTLKEAKKIHGYTDLNFNDISSLLEYPINDKSGLAITFRKSIINETYPLIIKNNDISRRLPVYYDWQFRYNYNISRKNKITFTHLGANDNYEFISENSSNILNYDDYSSSSFLIVNLFDWYFKINKNIDSNFSFSFQYNNRFFKVGEFVKVNTTPYLGILKENLSFNVSKFFKIDTGLELWGSKVYSKVETPSYTSDEFDNEVSLKKESKTYILNREYYLYALYFEGKFHFKKLDFNFGVRGEYISYNKSFFIDPRLTNEFHFSKNFLIKSAVGIFHQPPFEYQADEKIGNSNLLNQVSTQYSLGLEYNYKLFKSTIDFFYNNQKNLVIQDDNIKYNNNGYGKAYGAEIFIKYKLRDKFFVWLSYTLMKALYKDSSDSEWKLFDYDQTHIINLVSSYKIFKNINLSISIRYTTGLPYHPIKGSILDTDKNEYIPIYSSITSDRLKDFFQIDFKIDKKFNFKYWSFKTYIDIQNITNYRNEEGKAYNYDYSDFVLVEAIPFFPNIGIKGEF